MSELEIKDEEIKVLTQLLKEGENHKRKLEVRLDSHRNEINLRRETQRQNAYLRKKNAFYLKLIDEIGKMNRFLLNNALELEKIVLE